MPNEIVSDEQIERQLYDEYAEHLESLARRFRRASAVFEALGSSLRQDLRSELARAIIGSSKANRIVSTLLEPDREVTHMSNFDKVMHFVGASAAAVVVAGAGGAPIPWWVTMVAGVVAYAAGASAAQPATIASVLRKDVPK